MSEYAWTASSIRNWLWFAHNEYSVRVGVNCASLGSIHYQLDGRTTTLLLNGKKIPGGNAPFDSVAKARPELLEGERLHWTWSLNKGIIELESRLTGRKVQLLSESCYITDGARRERLDCRSFSKVAPDPTPVQSLVPAAPKVEAVQVRQEVPTPQPQPVVEEKPSGVSHWSDSIPEEHFRRVFKHLERHGTVNDDEVTELLDSTRQARAFGNKLDSYRTLVPFEIQVEATGTGPKTYRRLQ